MKDESATVPNTHTLLSEKSTTFKFVAVGDVRRHFNKFMVMDASLSIVGIAFLILAVSSIPPQLYASDMLLRGGLNQLLATMVYLAGIFLVAGIVALQYGWKARSLPIVILLIDFALIVIGSMYYDDALLSIKADNIGDM